MYNGQLNWIGTGLMTAIVVMFFVFSLNATGVTQFPFRVREPQQVQNIADLVESARIQCRFGIALLSAGSVSNDSTTQPRRRDSFAEAYADKIPGLKPAERRLVRDACLNGLARGVAAN